MPEEGQNVSPEGQPTGRGDPGGGGLSKRLGPLPLWAWGVVGVGILGFFWWQRQHGSSSPATQSGTLSGTSSDLGVGQVDPLTADALMQAMNDLTNRLAGQGRVTNPDPSNSPSSGDPGPGSTGDPSGKVATLPAGITYVTNALNGMNGSQSRSGAAGLNEPPGPAQTDTGAPKVAQISTTLATFLKPRVPTEVGTPPPPQVIRPAWVPGGISVVTHPSFPVSDYRPQRSGPLAG